MRAIFTLSTLLLTVSLCGQTIDKGERDFAMSHLHMSRKLFLDSIAGLSPEQLNFKASPERWSIAECVEHITLSEDLIFGLASSQSMKTPVVSERIEQAKNKTKDADLVKIVIDRRQKAQAPEALKPSHKWASVDEMIAEFKVKRNRTIEYVEQTKDDLRGHMMPHPLLGKLDSYQWVLLLSSHSERHTMQIVEVKAAPGFPKK